MDAAAASLECSEGSGAACGLGHRLALGADDRDFNHRRPETIGGSALVWDWVEVNGG